MRKVNREKDYCSNVLNINEEDISTKQPLEREGTSISLCLQVYSGIEFAFTFTDTASRRSPT